MKRSPATNARKRRAVGVLKKSKHNSIPKSVTLTDFREPTAAERVHGKSLATRAAELVSRKSRKLAVAH